MIFFNYNSDRVLLLVNNNNSDVSFESVFPNTKSVRRFVKVFLKLNAV